MRYAIFIWVAFFSSLIFSQATTTEEVALTNGKIDIPGCLSYAKNATKTPLAIFIHGSGNMDRNGNQSGLIKTNLIKLLADSLNAKGIAFYRYDKRTSVADNLPKIIAPRINDFVEDVKVAIAYFSKDDRFSSIHLIGHSQGALIGMLALDKKIASFTSLAGPAETVDKLLIDQITKQHEELGKITKMHIDELKNTDTIKTVNPYLLSIFAPQNQQFIKDWMLIDPAETLKKLPLPVLIINGKMDSQIDSLQAKQLKAAKPDAQLSLIPKMNHVLKWVENTDENQASYINPDYPLSSELVKVLENFIKKNG